MSPGTQPIARILLIHPEEATRRSLDSALRNMPDLVATVYEAASVAEGLGASRRVDPKVVILDLSGDRQLALEVARELRAPDRLVIGLYNPLLLAEGETAAFFRAATRSGVDDFVPLPVGGAELESALRAGIGATARGRAEREGRLIVFTSPKGGAGTTTVAANTALVLAGSGAVDGEVALCDAALPFGTAAATLGLAPNRDLADLVRDLDGLEGVGPYMTAEERTRLAVLAAPRDPYTVDLVSPESLSRTLIRMRRRYALTVVDTAPALDLLTLAALDLAERVYLVAEPLAPSVVVTQRYLRLLDEQGFGDRLRLVLNRYDGPEAFADQVVAERMGRSLDHRVPWDPKVLEGANRGVPPVLARPDSPYSEAIGGIAEEIVELPAVTA